MGKVKMVNKEASTTITIGTGVLQRFQQIFSYIHRSKSDDDIKKYITELEQHKDIHQTCSEEWMDHLKILGILIAAIEKQMIDEGKTHEVEIPDDDVSENNLNA